jgi:hypothetical protein
MHIRGIKQFRTSDTRCALAAMVARSLAAETSPAAASDQRPTGPASKSPEQTQAANPPPGADPRRRQGKATLLRGSARRGWASLLYATQVLVTKWALDSVAAIPVRYDARVADDAWM